MAGRLMFAAFGFGSVYFFFMSLKNMGLFKPTQISIAVLALTLISPLFLAQVVKIRSDMLSLFFSTALLAAATVKPQPWSEKRFVLVSVLHLALLGCTPRAIMHDLVALSLLVPWLLKNKLVTKSKKQILVAIGFPLMAFAVFALPISGFPGYVLIRYAQETYKQWNEWGHVWVWIYSEPALIATVALSLIYWVYKSQKKDLIWILPFLVAWLAIAGSNLKTPYLVGSFFPFLILPVLLASRFFSAKLVSLIAVAIFLSHPLMTKKYNWGGNNIAQKEVIQKVSLVLKENPTWRIFDGLGLFPRSREILSYLGPEDDRAIEGAWVILTSQEPEVVLYSARFSYMGNKLNEWLLNKYNPIAANLYVRKDLKTESKIELSVPPVFLFQTYPY